MDFVLQQLNRELLWVSETPVTPLTLLLLGAVALLSALAGPSLRGVLQRTLLRPVAQAAPGQSKSAKRFGTFSGVFTPSILTILGVIMYLRLGWVVGNVGLGGALLVVAISHLITAATGLSVSSIATNRTVGAGGAYFMISRSLGAPAGAAIGIPLFLAQAISVTFYVVGFTESLAILFPEIPAIAVSSLVCLVLTLITLKSADLAIKAQYIVMTVIVISLISFFSGRGDAPPPSPQWWNSEGEGFSRVFGVFFPAVTGIMAGVSMSGDLENPRRALPKGTMLAILAGFIVYMLFPIWLSMNADNTTMIRNKNVVWDIARLPSVIYLGVWGATLSSALGSILTAPRTLQALAADGLAPRFLARGSGPANEPRVGMLITFILAQIGILLGNLDAIAPILTMFFLAAYGVTNLACGLERWAASPSFRPDFTVSAAVSLFGALACFYVMSIINMLAMVSALVICGAIYLFTQRRVLGTTYGDARHGIWAALVRSALYRLRRAEFHPQNWRPNLIVMGGDQEKRAYLLQLGSSIVQDRGIVTYFQLIKGGVEDLAERRRDVRRQLDKDVGERFPNVFSRVDVVDDVYRGVVTVAQSYGVGSFEANTVMLGWLRKSESREAYVAMLRDLVRLDRSLLIVRYNHEKKFGKRQQIYIWWGGLQGNGGLMLLLAFLLTAHDQWRQAEVSVLTIVNDDKARAEAEGAIGRVLDEARVRATPRVLLRDGRPIPEIIRSESADADLAIIGLGLPAPSQSSQAFFERMAGILDGMPTTILVHSARDFRGEPVLFQTDAG
jgi:amino acid transporter/uncharacterized protein YlxP (DUF503 family)